jgi:hypothetical protein
VTEAKDQKDCNSCATFAVVAAAEAALASALRSDATSDMSECWGYTLLAFLPCFPAHLGVGAWSPGKGFSKHLFRVSS